MSAVAFISPIGRHFCSMSLVTSSDPVNCVLGTPLNVKLGRGVQHQQQQQNKQREKRAKIDLNCLSDLKLILILFILYFIFYSLCKKIFLDSCFIFFWSSLWSFHVSFFFAFSFSSVLCTRLRGISMSACREGPILIED